MKNFTIENETNNITVHGSTKEAKATPNSERFASESALGKLAMDWPAARLVEIWNSLPGVTKVKKFKDRPTAVCRIWKALQNLGDTTAADAPDVPTDSCVAPQDAHVAVPSRRKGSKAAKAGKASQKPTQPKAAREGSKTSRVAAMLKREGGTTVEEIMVAMDWQKHTTRALLSAGGSLTKKHGLTVISEKAGDIRKYYIKG